MLPAHFRRALADARFTGTVVDKALDTTSRKPGLREARHRIIRELHSRFPTYSAPHLARILGVSHTTIYKALGRTRKASEGAFQ